MSDFVFFVILIIVNIICDFYTSRYVYISAVYKKNKAIVWPLCMSTFE